MSQKATAGLRGGGRQGRGEESAPPQLTLAAVKPLRQALAAEVGLEMASRALVGIHCALSTRPALRFEQPQPHFNRLPPF